MVLGDSRSASQESSLAGIPRRWAVFAVAWALLSLLSICWSLATPVSASPDEPAHIVKAASVVRGQFVGEYSEFGHVVQVPRYVASTQAQTCFAFHPQVSAACAVPLEGEPAALIDSTTTAGLYNPVYYVLVGWPTLIFDDATGLYVMRIVSAMLCALFLACAIMIASTFRSSWLPIAAIGIAVSPMLLFLAGTVNPSALEASTTLAAFAAMTAIVLRPDRALLAERCGILAVSAAIAINARALSPLWLAVAILAPLILAAPGVLGGLIRTRPVLWSAGITALASAFAVSWIVGVNSLASGLGNDNSFQQYPGEGSSPLSGFLLVVRDTFDFAEGMIGIFGWLDTPAPNAVYFIWAALTGALLLAAFALLRSRALIFAVTLAGAFVFLPAIVQGAYINGGGIIWQGRYSLPLFAMLVFGLAAAISEQVRPSMSYTRRLVLIVAGSWLVAQALAFATTLRRYAVGTDGTWGEMLGTPEWSAPGGNLAAIICFIAVAGATAYLWWRSSIPRRPARVRTPASERAGR
jgi:hypothetical protein